MRIWQVKLFSLIVSNERKVSLLNNVNNCVRPLPCQSPNTGSWRDGGKSGLFARGASKEKCSFILKKCFNSMPCK